MSWLNEIKHTYLYKCEDEHVSACEERTETVECFCEGCGKQAAYAGFEPVKLGQTVKMGYEQNGRLATKTMHPDGRVTCISKTKEHFMKTGKNESQLSREYTQHVQDKQMDEFGRYRKQLESRATVTSASKGAIE